MRKTNNSQFGGWSPLELILVCDFRGFDIGAVLCFLSQEVRPAECKVRLAWRLFWSQHAEARNRFQHMALRQFCCRQ